MTDDNLPSMQAEPTARQRADSLWGVEDVKAYLNVSDSTVRRHVRSSGLPARRIGRFLRFDPIEVEEWARNREAA